MAMKPISQSRRRYGVKVRYDAEKVADLLPPLLTEAERLAQTVSSGLHGRKRAGSGEVFWQHRPYIAGDPVSTIDWRQSARAPDRLYVRENEWESAASVWFWRDASKSMDFRNDTKLDTKRRRADVLAVALSILLTRAGEKVGVFGAQHRAFYGQSGPRKFLEALEMSPFREAESAPPTTVAKVGSRTIFISDFYTNYESIETSIKRQARNTTSGLLIQVVDPAEEDFPYRGRVEFQDMESADKILFGQADSIAETYKIRYRNHQRDLENLCKAVSWNFVRHRTDQSVLDALRAAYFATQHTA